MYGRNGYSKVSYSNFREIPTVTPPVVVAATATTLAMMGIGIIAVGFLVGGIFPFLEIEMQR